MKRFAAYLLLLGLVGSLVLLAEGPDDQFVRLYNLIQQADALRDTGQIRAAQQKYLEAQAALDKLQASHPVWNEKIIKYRKNYIAERLGSLTPTPGAPAPAGVKAAIPPATDARTTQINALSEEIKTLKSDRDLLQAKLREALSVQPAAVDPRELAKAEERVKDLLKQNDLLKVSLDQQQAKLSKSGDSVALEEAQKALKEANRALARQTDTIAALNKEKQSLQEKLKKSGAKATAKPRGQEPKGTAAPPLAPLVGGTEPAAQVADLTAQLQRAQAELAVQHSRAELLQTEKSTLEKRLAQLSTRGVTPPPLAAVPPKEEPTKEKAVKEKTAKETKAAKAVEKFELKQLEKERDDLRKRVVLLSRQLEDRRVRKSGQGELADQLNIARARLEVYEARQVPYSPEELALFQKSAVVTKAEPKGVKKAARELPAGAVSLVAEAQRAFESRRFSEAEQKFQQVLKLDEKNVATLTDLAAAQLEQNKFDDADASLKRALAGDPNDGQALSLMGLLRFRQQRFDEALEVLTRAAQLDPDNPITQNYLGIVLSQKGQRTPAETAFRRALQLQPGYAEAHSNLAVVYATQKPPYLELARWHYRKARAAGHPEHAELEKALKPLDGGNSTK